MKFLALNLTSREDAEVLIPEEELPGIVQGIIAESTVLQNFGRLRDMRAKELSIKVLDSLPMAYWVNGDTGIKQTTKMDWDKVTIIAEEIAVIIPIPDNVVEDARANRIDLWSEYTPMIRQAFGQKIDEAIIFGIDKPTGFRDSLYTSASATGNHVITGTGDLWADIFGENGVLAAVEESGFDVNGIISRIGMRGAFRNMRDEGGNPIFMSYPQQRPEYSLYSIPLWTPRNGAWQNDLADLLVGDMSQAVYSIRQDMTAQLFTEGVISDDTGKVLLNLMQQDTSALRVKMRMGWQLPNPINALQPDRDERFPFAFFRRNA